MSLFAFSPQNPLSLLPFDGTVLYYGKCLSERDAWNFYELLWSQIEWKHDEALFFGKHVFTKRKVAWYGDQPYAYTYSNTTKRALPWTSVLKQLKRLTEQLTGETFNSCLLNLYHDGKEGMAWHSDGEKDLKKDGAIASMSLGAERRFLFKHKQSGDSVGLMLEHGSLLLMRGKTQTYWQHRLPPSAKIHHPRINLTFRTMVEGKL